MLYKVYKYLQNNLAISPVGLFVMSIFMAFYVLGYGFSTLYFVTVTFQPEKILQSNEWALSLFLMFGLPFLTFHVFKKYSIVGLEFMLSVNILITGFAAVLWYVYPENPRLEQAVFIIGALAAVTKIYMPEKAKQVETSD